MDHDNDVAALSGGLQSLDVSSESYGASGTKQRLPDELLEMIAQEADFEDLRSLALTNKWLSEACKPMLWRSVTVEGDFEQHEDKMIILAKAGASRHIRRINYTQPRPFSKLSAYHLSTFTGVTMAFLNLPPTPDDEESTRDSHAVPKALSDALRCLPRLRYLSLDLYGHFADTSFSLARHMPQLEELVIPTFPFSVSDSDLPFIYPSPPALRRLEIAFDAFAAQGIAATAGTVQQLLVGNRLYRDWDVEPLDYFEELKRTFQRLVEGMGTTPWALENLWLAGFQMGSDPDHFEGLLGVLSSLQHSPVQKLRLSGFFTFEYHVANPTFSLPNVTQLDLQTDNEDVELNFLDEDTFPSLALFLRCFPNLKKLTLANWAYTIDPTQLIHLDGPELDDYWPLLRRLLIHIHTKTKIDSVRVKQRRWDGPFNHSSLEAIRAENSFNFKVLTW